MELRPHPWPDPDPDCWLHPDAEVRSSPVAGVGLFARRPIPAGTAVSRLGGRLVKTPELRRLLVAARAAGEYLDTITVDGSTHLVLPPGRPNGKGNHGCDPNLWWAEPWTLVSRRDVARNEELTNDYATSTGEPGFSLPCRCGSRLCRGVVTGQDWSRPDLQERYGAHWVPGLLDRIRVS